MRQFFVDSEMSDEQLALLLESEDQSNLLTELEYGGHGQRGGLP